MGKQKNELFELIKRLDSHEKAYYKKLAKRHAQHNSALHLQLFDLIDTAAEDNDLVFSKALKLKPGAQYSGIKNYLWNDLLDTLVFLKRNESVHAQINFLMIQLEALINKGMIAGARKQYEKAWGIASLHELYDQKVALLNIRITLDKYLLYDDYEKAFLQSFEMIQEASEKLLSYQKLDNLFNRLLLSRKTNYMRFSKQQLDNINEIIAQTLAIKTDAPLNEIFKACVLSIAYHLSFCFKESAGQNELLLTLWNKYNHLMESYSMLFIYCADNTFYNDFALNHIDVAERHIQSYSALADLYLTGKRSCRFWEITLFNNELKIFHKTGQYDKVEELTHAKAAYVVALSKNTLTNYRQITLRSSLCISAFVLGKYKQAKEYLADIKEMNHNEQSDDILYFTSIFQLLILFENKEWYELSNAVSASYLKLYNKKQLHPFEKEVMLFLKKFTLKWTKQEADEEILAFLEKLKKYKNDPIKKFYFLYFNYYAWLESKVAGVKYTEYMVQQLNTSGKNMAKKGKNKPELHL